MLTLKFDKRTARLSSDGSGYQLTNAVVKRRDAVAVSITIYLDGVAEPFPSGTMMLGLKQQGKHSGAIVATASLTVSASSYVGTLSLNTTEVANLFAGVGLPPTEPAYVMLVAELTHSAGWTAETIPVRCENDYIAGDEPAPGESTSALFVALAAAVAAAEADRVATAADRVQTGLDSSSASGSASTATSQAGIALSQALLADADRVQTGLDRVQTGLDKAQTIADAAATAADRVQTGLDRAQTVADRVQTGLDRVQTGQDRTAASDSAAAAAASATTALNAISQAFKGGLAGASVPATSTATGDTYRITTAGTSQSKTWVVGDAAIYNGTSGSWTQLTGFYVYADAADLVATAALIEREGLRFDGTAGAVIGNGGIPAVGTGDFTFICNLTPLANASNPRILGSTGAANDLSYNSSTGAFEGLAVYTPTLTFSLGNPQILALSRTGSGLSASINGGSASTGTSASSLVAFKFLMGVAFGGNLGKGSIARSLFFNYALTAGEISALTRRGLVTLPEQRGGSMVALNDSFYGAGSSATTSSTSATGATLTYVGGANSAIAFRFGSRANLLVGQRYKVNFTATLTSGIVPIVELADLALATRSSQFAVTPGANSVILTVSSASTSGIVGVDFLAVGGNTTYTISSLSVIPLGTLFEQDSGQRNAGYMVRDTSGNNLDLILPASGVSVIDPAMRGTIRFTTNLATNVQIGSAQVIIPTNARITSWVINSSGTPNVTLGNVAAGAQFRASAAVVTGDNQIALLTPFTPTGNLWVNSSTTATLKHTIQWEYIQ